MTTITLVKLPDGSLRGMSEADQVAYKNFKTRLSRLEEGELCSIEAKLPRNSRHHRKFFAMLNLGFDAWEPQRKHKSYKGREVQKNFEIFRADVLIAAGFYEQTFGLDGRLRLEPKSISFARMEQPEFEEVYNRCLDVLLADVLSTYAGREEVNNVVEKMLRFA
ncbi:DUF1367 family protein [Methylotenera sp.]|uniref:DUF1367 family protein n=1 Tax=Methylotenera sp. TaxID=2051956 RepID=UPI002ED8D536